LADHALHAVSCALEIRRQAGYVPENDSFIPGLSAVAYVALAGRLVGMNRIDAMQRTHVVLNYLGLHEERYRPIESYSTGMRQKVKFAQALVHHPRLLLLDEPTSGLDPAGRQEMLDLIRDIVRNQGIHILLSTHLLHDVEVTCDEIVLMNRGRVVVQDTLDRLKGTPPLGFDVDLRGDRSRFLVALSTAGVDARETGPESVCAIPSPDTGSRPILEAARSAGVQIRHLSRRLSPLDELFTRLIEESGPDRK
jgi:ABC-2 type transport system ATP-binding protein